MLSLFCGVGIANCVPFLCSHNMQLSVADCLFASHTHNVLRIFCWLILIVTVVVPGAYTLEVTPAIQ